MKQYLSLQKIVFALAFIVLIIGVSAFGQNEKGQKDSFRQQRSNDSGASRQPNRDGAYRIDLLGEEMKKLDVEMKKLDVEMKKMDFSRIEKDIEQAMKAGDWDKINKEIESGLAAVEKVDMANVRNELRKAKVQMEKERQQMSLAKVHSENIREHVEGAMKEARKSMERAKEEMKDAKTLLDLLHKDGIIDKAKTKSIEVKDGQLIIDGKKQPKEVSDKYKPYYKKENFRFQLNEDGDDRI